MAAAMAVTELQRLGFFQGEGRVPKKRRTKAGYQRKGGQRPLNRFYTGKNTAHQARFNVA